MGELDDSLDVSSSAGKSVEHGVNVCALLHRDDTELVLFIDPDEESLLLVVEDTSAVRPVVVEANSLKETISLPK